MDTVLSKDGTKIAYEATGRGPPLVLVHGTTADHTRWAPVLEPLGKHFTVCAMDRRGRGASGDTLPYSIGREFEDVAAVVDSLESPVRLLGHSYGALCSLEASLTTSNLRRMVLYEPPIPTNEPMYPEGQVQRLDRLLAAGDPETLLLAFFKEVVRMPEKELAVLKSLPNWKARVAAAWTIPREMHGDSGYVFYPRRFARMTVPTLLLMGGESPAFLKAATNAVQTAIPNAQTVVMPGQQHTAMNTAPELFLREVLGFLAPGGVPA